MLPNKKYIVMAILVVGVIVALIGILADSIGLGEDTEHFGDRQILVTVIGLAIIAVGLGVHFFGDRFFKKDGEGAGG